MILSEYIASCLANLMWNNFGEDGFPGMTAVGLLVRNRVLAGWDSGNWLKSIQDFDKYEGNPAATPRALVLGDPVRDDKFRRCLAIASSIYEGREKDILYGATRGAKLSDCSEEFANKIVRPTALNPDNGCTELIHKRVAQVGQKTFFK